MKKLILGLALAFVANAAMAADPVEYLDWDSTTSNLVEKTCTAYELVTADTTAFEDGKWYVVAGNVVIDNGSNIKVNGSAHLILCDNASLTIKNVAMDNAAIDVSVSGSVTNALTICGQQGGSGVLSATGGNFGAGIGTAEQSETAEGCGVIVINGGTVTAQGGDYGAGIGGGEYGAGGTVTVNGGVVTATGGDNGAGIGGGSGGAGGIVAINGGSVTATGGNFGAGIGGGYNGADGEVTRGENVIVVEGAVGNGSSYVKLTDVRLLEIETFGSDWYVTAANGVYMDTLFRPDSNTRVEMDVLVGGAKKREYWFGCWTNDWNNGAFALGNDGDSVYCGYGSGNTCGGIKGLGTIPSGRVTVALEKGVVYTNGVVWSDAHRSDTPFGLDQNLYLFAQNRAGTAKPGDGQERIDCYGCRIWTNGVNGAAVPVRNFVPARTKGALRFVGLYDTVTGEFYMPSPRGRTLTLACDIYLSVTIGGHPHMTAAWTSGDGSVTNAIGGTAFEVQMWTENVKVIFTPEHNYRFKDAHETGVRTLESPLMEGCEVTPPEIEEKPGTVVNPWSIGEAVTAYVSDENTLVIEGTGAMDDFASAADAPWAAIADEITAVTIAESVTHVGKNAFAGMENLTSINGEDVKSTYRTVSTVNGKPIEQFNMMGGALGYAPLAYPSESSALPSGAISGAEFEQVQIIDGKAYLDVSVYTSDTLTNQNWSVATNGVIEVPAPGKQGFFYLMSKPAVPSNKPFVPPPLPIEQ